MTKEEAGGGSSGATDALDSSLTQATGAGAWLSEHVGVKCATVGRLLEPGILGEIS